MIDFALTDAQREVQRTARAFAEREILPRIRELDERYPGRHEGAKLENPARRVPRRVRASLSAPEA